MYAFEQFVTSASATAPGSPILDNGVAQNITIQVFCLSSCSTFF